MNQKCEIQKRQNSIDMLNCQYAARFCFNRAESMGYLALVISMLSALCVFLPDSDNVISLAIPTLISFFSIVIQGYSEHIQKKAAMLRNYFDAVVLGINESNYTLEDRRKIQRYVLGIIAKKPREHQIQIENTGLDTPPGVRDWYNLSFDETGTSAVFECQKQNYGWTKDLACKRIQATAFFIVTMVIICVIVIWAFKVPALKWLASFLAFAFNRVTNGRNSYRHYRIMEEIHTIVKMPDIESNPIQIEHLQKKISEMRELPVLEINAIHKHYNKQWTELYESMIKNRR